MQTSLLMLLLGNNICYFKKNLSNIMRTFSENKTGVLLHKRKSTFDYETGRGSWASTGNWGVMDSWWLLGKEESGFLLRVWLLVRWPSSGRRPYPQKYGEESTNWSQWGTKTNKQKDSTREMAQQLRVCTAFVEDSSSNPSIHNRKVPITTEPSLQSLVYINTPQIVLACGAFL